MPTYAYACTECGHRFDAVQSFSDDALTTCPECGGTLRKQFGSVGVVFKGSGFYRNDSRASSSTSSSTTSPSSGSSSGSDSSSGGSGSSASTSSGSSSSGTSSSSTTSSSTAGSAPSTS